MSGLGAPLPASGSFIKNVRSSCAEMRSHANISINEEAVAAFLTHLDRADFERLSRQHGLTLPLSFDSVAEEVNLLAVLSLLNFLSAYRAPLHKATGSGAYQAVLRLVIGLYISGPNALSALALKELKADGVASLLNVSTTQESSSGIPGVVLGQPNTGDMYEVCQLVARACNSTGEVLLRLGLVDLGSLVLKALERARTLSDEERCEAVLAELVSTIPAFADAHLIDGSRPVYLFKKAFFLLQAISQRGVANAPSTKTLPMFVDNVLPTMLIQLGILDTSNVSSSFAALKAFRPVRAPETDSKGAKAQHEAVEEGPRLSAEEAYVIRASALDAGSFIVKRAHEIAQQDAPKYEWLGALTEADLDGYLWSVAKDDASLRRVPRLVERGTIMY
ncbi:hypothetical protein IE81DRAFT_290241 [Ceraceosorus guamensis]|uniref:Queuosine 5'-phosphate N-glycosylase/hydrolase n=1 Tax=Ceraceosorus guamensis TaxID=1522189 RepID=A0A316VXT9_9BASI|nr:hypothetical protein IE81DRAFT_290241 [Ceraceosorus guamensis]PWN42446.1 hypothetical protein IE81DRAFT_290241 [Ceraceosorus guamensis]